MVVPLSPFVLGLSPSGSDSGSDLEDELMVGFENGVAKPKGQTSFLLLCYEYPNLEYVVLELYVGSFLEFLRGTVIVIELLP